MNDEDDRSTKREDAVMSAEVADLVVWLQQQLNAAYADLDAALADAGAIREQRGILFQQLHGANKRIKQQDARIAALCDELRDLRPRQKAAA